jgi:hypothetical protein
MDLDDSLSKVRWLENRNFIPSKIMEFFHRIRTSPDIHRGPDHEVHVEYPSVSEI